MKKLILYSVLLMLVLTAAHTNIKGQTTLQAQTGFYTDSLHYSWTEEWVKLNDTLLARWTCAGHDNGLKFVVFDSSTCEPWLSPGTGVAYFHENGSFHCQAYDTYCFDFFVETDSMQNVIANFISTIPQNDMVLVMSHKNHFCQEWNDSIVNAFRSIGSSIDNAIRIPDGYPYILFGRKGVSPGSANYVIGDASGDLVMLNDTLPCSASSVDELCNEKISVYPNPSYNSITINIGHAQMTNLLIFSITGQLVLQQSINSASVTIDVSRLQRGMYILQVKSEGNVFVKKMIKQ